MLSPVGEGEHEFGHEHEHEYEYEGLPAEAPPMTHMIAGAMAGIAEHTFTYPIDSIKTRMQILRPHPSAVYTGLLHALRSVATTEGHTRLWRGVGSVVLGAGPAHALYFATYERAKRLLVKGEAGTNPLTVGMAGGLATAVSDACMTPFDVVKQRMQVHGSSHAGIFACARSILRSEGLGGFFVSYPATLILNVPFHMIQFPVYEASRRLLSAHRAPTDYAPITHIVSGGVAGGVAAFCTTPIDVIKTTLQTRNLVGGRVSGMREAVSILLRERGPGAFLMGAVPRAVTFIPGTAICWSVYEYFKWILRSG